MSILSGSLTGAWLGMIAYLLGGVIFVDKNKERWIVLLSGIFGFNGIKVMETVWDVVRDILFKLSGGGSKKK